MKRLITILCLVGLLAPPLAASEPEAVLTAYRPGLLRVPVSYRLRLRRACLLSYYYAAPAGQWGDPLTVSLLTRIADQQQAMATQLMMLQRPVQADPSLLAMLQQLVSGQDRVLAAINEGKVSDAETKGVLQSMVAGQQQLILQLQQQASRPAPPPVVVTPPAPAPTPPPVVVVPPSSGGSVVTLPPAGGGVQGLPGPGGALQALPGAGGSIQVLPPAGGSLQALPGPGGSIQVLPGGTPPPAGTTPAIPPAGTTPALPGSGNPMAPLPAAGGLIPIVPTQSRLTPPTQNRLVPFRYSLFQTTQNIDPRLLPR